MGETIDNIVGVGCGYFSLWVGPYKRGDRGGEVVFSSCIFQY